MSFDPEQCRNEREVESKLIVQYLLPRLGYSPDTWHQEVTFEDIRVDFLASATPALSVVIEAKHPRENLDKHVRRLKRYLTTLRVRYGLLTNGKEIRIYEIIGAEIQLVFQCSGTKIESEIEIINNLIGQKNKNTDNRNSPKNFLSRTITTTRRNNKMKTIAIYHHKGGVGKTTVSINLAAALRKRGKRVLLIDIDAQANSTFATGLVKFIFEEDDNIRDRNVYNLLESSKYEHNYIPGLVRKSNFFNQPEIDVIPSHITLIERQNKLLTSGASRFRLAKKLEQVRDQYDIVIIDTPPSLDIYAQVALIAADYLIIPSDLKPFSNQGLTSVKNFIEQEINENKEGLGKEPLILMGVLPSKISTHAQYLKYTYPKQKAVITDRYKLPLMESSISERTALSHCLNQTLFMGNLEIPDPKSILEYAEGVPSANISATEFEALALEVLTKMGMN